MKKAKKTVLLLVFILTVVGLNVFYNDEKNYEYKNNSFLEGETLSTECSNVKPTDNDCKKKGTITSNEWVQVGEPEEVSECKASETDTEQVKCKEQKKYIKTTSNGEWVSSEPTYTTWSCSDSYPGSCTSSSNDTETVSCTKYMTQKSCTRTASSTWSKQSCSEVSTCVPKTGPTERVTCNQEDRDSYTSPTCSAGYIGSGPNLSPNYCYNSNGKIIGDAKCPAGTTMTSKGCKTVKTVTVECVQTKTGTTYGEWNCTTSYPSSCTSSENQTRKVECSGPNYKKSTCTRSLISSGDYVKWTIINTETVDSCTEKKDTLHKVECSEKKSFIKTTSKKGTIEVCEQCVVRTPDTEKPVVEISSKKCENGSCIISAKLTDNVGVVEFAYSKNSDEKKVSDWISLGTSYTEKIVEIKNVDETKTAGTYYVFAKDAAGNIGKKEYIITAKDLEKETALDLGVNLKQEDTIIKNVVRVTNNSKLSYNVCNIVIEVPIDNNVTLVKDSINISGIDKTLVKTNIETNKITFIIDKMLQVNEKIEITFDTKLKNNNVKKVTLEPTVEFYETKEQTCSKDKESDIVISKKQDLKVVIISNVPDTGRSTTTFVILGTISLAIGTGLVYNILKKSKYLIK
jgi:hypothetical protein